MAYTFKYLGGGGPNDWKTITTDQDLRQTAGGSKFILVENQQPTQQSQTQQPTQQPQTQQPQTQQPQTQQQNVIQPNPIQAALDRQKAGTATPTDLANIQYYQKQQELQKKQQELQIAQQRINAGQGTATDKANVEYALKTGLLKPVEATPYTPSDAQMSLGDTSSYLTVKDIEKSILNPLSVLSDQTYNINNFRQDMASVTNSFLSGVEQDMASLYNRLLTINQREQEKKQAEVDRLSGQLEETANISLYDKAEELLERFQVEANLKLYQDLQTKAVDASRLMQDAIDNYDTTTYLTTVVSARKNQLYQQGLNVITSLKATAEIVKGNIDLSNSYVDRMIKLLDNDRNTKLNTYASLLELNNNDLISLKNEEKAIIRENIRLLEKEADRIQKDKDVILAIYNADPIVAYKAGVYFTDTPQEAQVKIAKFLEQNPTYYPNMIKQITTTDRAGNEYVVGLNNYTAKIEYQVKIGEKYEKGTSKSSNDTNYISQANIQRIEKNLLANVGADGYVSPDDYANAKADWVYFGGTPAAFDEKFKDRRNPSNPYYDVSEQIKPNDKNIILNFFNQGYGYEELLQKGFDKTSVDEVAKEIIKTKLDNGVGSTEIVNSGFPEELVNEVKEQNPSTWDVFWNRLWHGTE